jgi:hypothetical protein
MMKVKPWKSKSPAAQYGKALIAIGYALMGDEE